ncbi:NAD(+) kinase [Candidatus Berkiella cookevillensis]|uniref:NAD kinase n=1 Tax=Candidatus Berkiella cookevillensis TaxID=437022 RepID=A0A0Q9YPF1_9GAMM|nr:NAD(+) kinase [Candidatus Berkiella cookevillensis]MCS5707816.1 NAD(+) kinase [Candidatus Berkiella cookevillensis]
MANLFSHIGIIGRPGNPEVQSTLSSLVQFLQSQHHTLSLESECAEIISIKVNKLSKEKLGELCDLIIVVGGDGSFLDAARSIVNWGRPMVGINRGRLGFLTDISPQAFKQYLLPILQGKYQTESRFLLDMTLMRDNQAIGSSSALNDVVLYSGDIARMIEFEVRINQQFVYRLRSDGLITATPTGSTAYSLSGGGPILHPTLEAVVLVPMHPHTLTSRPIVLDSDDKIELHITSANILHPRVSCDGQVNFNVLPNDRILISKKDKLLNLLHPLDYDYYHTLRTKLNWSI